MIQVAAAFSSLSILGFLLVWYGVGPDSLSRPLLVLCAIAMLTLLGCGYRRVVSYAGAGSQWLPRPWILGHLVLHVIPLAYVAMQLKTDVDFRVNALYLGPIMLFFWTGRRTWNALYRGFGSKMYRIFFLGNTALLLWSPVLLGLGLVNEDLFGNKFGQVLMGYFAIHFLLTGGALVKIERDLLSVEQ